MGYIIPVRDMTPEQKQKRREYALECIKDQAVKIGLSRTKLSIRDLLPQDLGIMNWTIGTVFNSWMPWIQHRVIHNGVISICSVMNLSPEPHVTDLKIIKNGCVIGKHNLMNLYAGLPTVKSLQQALLNPVAREILDRMSPDSDLNLHVGMPSEGWFSDPYIFSGSDSCDISVSGINFNGLEHLVLSGFIIEPAGTTIM